MNKMLNDYFEKAKMFKDETPPYSPDELLSIIEFSKTKSIKSFLKKYKGLIIMITLFLSLMTILFLNNQVNDLKNKKIEDKNSYSMSSEKKN